MSEGSWPAIQPRWRDEGSPQEVAAATRRRRVRLLLLIVACIAGVVVIGLPYLRPPARSRLLPLFVTASPDRPVPPLPWRNQDRDALVGGDLFTSITDVSSARSTQATLVQQMTALRRRHSEGALVVYLSSRARTDAEGHVQLLASDADPDDPSTWLPLARLLDLFRKANVRHRLLILDLEPPPSTRQPHVVLDDVWACVKTDLDAVPDPDRLVLCAAGPGQQTWTSEVLQRSIFGYYVTEALRGEADTNGNGQVTALEMIGYVRSRVDRWARRNRETRQTPVMHGDVPDFILADLPNAEALPPVPRPDDRTYPAWLEKAWNQSAKTRERWPRLAAAERDWRSGADPERVQQEAQAALAMTSPPAPPTPRPKSLALALAGQQVPATLADDFRQTVYRASARTRGQAKDKAEQSRVQLADEFLKAHKDTAIPLLEKVALDVTISDPRSDTLAFAATLLRRLEIDPGQVETLDLLRLSALDLSPTALQRALDAIRGSELAASRPRLFGWLAGPLEAAAQARHEMMVLFESGGYAQPAEAELALERCATRTAMVLSLQDVLQDALDARDDARGSLPDILLFQHAAGQPTAAWLQAVRQVVVVSDRLDAARKGGLSATLDDVRRQAALLQGALTPLRAPFTPDGIDQAIHAAGGGNAGGQQWRQLNGLLTTTLVPPGRRVAIWSASMNLTRRIEDETYRLDRLDGAKPLEVPPIGEEQAADVVRQNAREASALVALAGLPAAQRQKLDALATGQGTRAEMFDLEADLRAAWPSLPVRDPPTGLWAWLADRFRYASRDYNALGPDSMAAGFYGRAASEYQTWLPGSRELYAEVIESYSPPRLLPGTPITPVLEIRTTTGLTKPPRMHLDLFAPDREWLDIHPTRLDLPSAGVKTSADGSFLVPIRIALRASAGEGKAPMPLGVLARVRLDEDRTFHRRVPVPLMPRPPEILLSYDDKAPDPALPGVRLRAIPERQTYYLYLRNPIDRVWKKLQVKLSGGGEVRETAVFELPARGVKKLTFPPAATTAIPTTTPAVPPAAPGSPPATPAIPALPALEGALRIEVFDLENKSDPIVSRDVGVDLAFPGEYVSITGVGFDPSGGRNRVSVRLRLRRKLHGPEVTARLGFPTLLDGGATYTDGTLQRKLPANGDEVTLFADGVSGRDGKAIFHVSIDGWERAFLFEATLSAREAVTPRQLFNPVVRPRVDPFVLAGPSFKVPVEVDNAPVDSRLEVTVGRLVGGDYRVEVLERRDTARDRHLGWQPPGLSGALVFDASLRDWTITMDTTRIRGVRELRARLLGRGGRELALGVRTLVLGDTAPAGAQFVDPPSQAWRQVPLALRARANDPVGIKSAGFFLGRPMGDKLPANVTPVPGTAINDEKTLWGVKMPLPTDRKGPTDVSVQFTNALGLHSYATTTINLLENDPAKTAPASIRGKVVEGDRAQSGLDVVLSDAKGAEVKKVKTAADGTFVFADLAPGKYRLLTTRPSPGMRRGTYPRDPKEFIDLAPGGTVTAEIPLYLP